MGIGPVVRIGRAQLLVLHILKILRCLIFANKNLKETESVSYLVKDRNLFCLCPKLVFSLSLLPTLSENTY